LTVGPLFACLPKCIHMATKLAASIDLLLSQIGLFVGEEAGPSLACYGMCKAVIRAMTSLGVLRASAPRFAALDRTFGQGAAAHGFGIGQLGGEMPNLGRDIGRSRSGHTLILRQYKP
jgi:hypothetical protein